MSLAAGEAAGEDAEAIRAAREEAAARERERLAAAGGGESLAPFPSRLRSFGELFEPGGEGEEEEEDERMRGDTEAQEEQADGPRASFHRAARAV